MQQQQQRNYVNFYKKKVMFPVHISIARTSMNHPFSTSDLFRNYNQKYKQRKKKLKYLFDMRMELVL